MESNLNLKAEQKINSVENFKFEPIKGYPMLSWKGKRPFTSTQYFPAQLKEQHGEEVNNWINQIFWGDNLQVMSHLLKKFRGQVDLIYIDPPFDSKADYKKKIKLKGKELKNDINSFEEKQYTDIWTNDEYLQFMYERLIILRELLSDKGSIYLHCDPHKSHYLKIILDEIFGSDNFLNEVIWCYGEREASTRFYNWKHDVIFFFQKTNDNGQRVFNWKQIALKYSEGSVKKYNLIDEDNRKFQIRGSGGHLTGKQQLKIDDELQFPQWTYRDYFDEKEGVMPRDYFTDINFENRASSNRTGYPTQKPEKLLERLIKASTNPGDIVFDCFMGSGTTQAVAMKLGRRFIGADINLGAIQTTTKRLINVANEIKQRPPKLEFGNDNEEENKVITTFYTGFQVYNVNNYDFFRNPVEARDILIKALEVQPLTGNVVYDGEKDGRMVKIMPVNRIATRVDLNELITNFDYKTFEKRNNETPKKPVEYITLVCMGHEPDLASHLKEQMKQSGYEIDVEVVDILRDKSNLELKRDSEAQIVIEGNKVLIREFYPMNLLQKLSIMKEGVENWKELAESVMIDFNYDGSIFEPSIVDIPEGNNLVKGMYDIPANAGSIHVKITDLLSETFETTL